MIARVLATAHVAVHAGGNKALRQRRTEQKMIDAEPGVAGEGITKVTKVGKSDGEGTFPGTRDNDEIAP
jgi:hypothetical protein